MHAVSPAATTVMSTGLQPMATYRANSHLSASTLTIADATDVSLTAVAFNAQEERPRASGVVTDRFGGGRNATSQFSRPDSIAKEHYNQDDDQQRLTGVDKWDVDPANPRNWSTIRKWRNAAIVSFYTLIACAPTPAAMVYTDSLMVFKGHLRQA